MSDKTRERIEAALYENHYETAARIKGAAEEKMTAVAFCMTQEGRNVLLDPFCGELLGAIGQELKKYDRRMLYDEPVTEEELLRLFAPWNVDGGIVLGLSPGECASLTHKAGKPLVFIDSWFEEEKEEYDNIGLQDYEGMREITSYLLKLGHRRIAFFSDQAPPRASNLERFKGYRAALAGYGAAFEEGDFYFLPEDKNIRCESLRQFVRKEAGRYTAAVFVSDYFANEAISVFFSQGCRVPDDLSVTGFDDNIYARLSRPMLTTVRQSPTEKGRKAVRLLMQRVRGEKTLLRTVRLPTELIVRDSVKGAGG